MPQPPARQFSGIFVSYRRDDSSGHAGRLFDRLSAHFGAEQVFMDIDHIEPGEDFVTVIENAVGSCDILIAVIGRHWLTAGGQESRRLDNPTDFVRLEIVAALNRDIRVIPVLVHGASMPRPQDVSDDLSKLCQRHAVELSDLRWRADVDQLIAVMERVLTQREETRRVAKQQREEEQQRQEAEAREFEETRRREAAKLARQDVERQTRAALEREIHRRSADALPQIRGIDNSSRNASVSNRRLLLIPGLLSLLVLTGSVGFWFWIGKDSSHQGVTSGANVSSSPDPLQKASPTNTQPANAAEPTASQTNTTNAVNSTKPPANRLSNSKEPAVTGKKSNGETKRQRCALAALENRPCP